MILRIPYVEIKSVFDIITRKTYRVGDSLHRNGGNIGKISGFEICKEEDHVVIIVVVEGGIRIKLKEL
jgi:hypothetical protein